MIDAPAPPATRRWPRRLLWATLGWGLVAALASTHQWTELQGTGKQMSWLAAFLWQGVSWLLLVPATPLLLGLIRRAPIEREHPERTVGHFLASLAFGGLFLLVAVPVRDALHPAGVRWGVFGEAFYKSAPQFMVIGVAAYWLIVGVASLVETRERLARLRRAAAEQPPAPTPDDFIRFETPVGVARHAAASIVWAEPAATGARLHTDDGAVLVRARLGELETMLAPWGFARVHRGVLVNARRVREVIGAPSRDGMLVLDTGARAPVSRRRRATLDAALADEPAPLAP